MATTLPADATKANTDQGTDDPKQALLDDLAAVIDKFNTLKGALGAGAQLSLDPNGGLQIIGRAGGTPDDISVKLATDPGLGLSASGLILLLQAASGLDLAVDGLKLNVDGLTAITAPAVADTLAIYDASASGSRQITFANFLKIINLLAEDVSPDGAADFLLTFDASTGLAKKVKLDNVAGATGQWQKVGSTVVASSQASVPFSGMDLAGINLYKVLWNNVYTSTGGTIFLRFGDGGGIVTGPNYRYASHGKVSNTTEIGTAQENDSKFIISGSLGNSIGQPSSGEVKFHGFGNGAMRAGCRWNSGGFNVSSKGFFLVGGGQITIVPASGTYDQIDLFMSSGLITAGDFILEQYIG